MTDAAEEDPHVEIVADSAVGEREMHVSERGKGSRL